MTSISRRGFVAGTLAAAAALEVGVPAFAGTDVADVTGTDPKGLVQKALEQLGGMKAFVKPGDFVVIKANAGFANPAEWATTTNPLVVRAVVEACLAAKAGKVVVVEHPQGKADQCFSRCGIAGALEGLSKVSLQLLGEGAFKEIPVKGGKALRNVKVAKLVLSADVLISVPVAKAHRETGVSFGLKNNMGLIDDRQAFHTSLDLHQAIADLSRVIRPNLTILDGTRVLLNNGPAGPGDVAAKNRIIAGRNIAQVDQRGLSLSSFGAAKHVELALHG